jgi:hypothetical protein
MAHQIPIGVPIPFPAPRHFHVPWKEIVISAIVLIVVATIAYGAKTLYSNLTGGENTAPFDAVQGKPVAQLLDDSPRAKPLQQVAASFKEWPKVEISWEATRISNRSANTIAAIPTEKGFYSGSTPSGYSFSPGSKEPGHESARFAWRVLPQLEGNHGILVAAVRDEVNKDIVLASIITDKNPGYLLLSVNGEKTWCELTKVPPLTPLDRGRSSNDVRVQLEGDVIRLYAADSSVGVWWWTAAVDRNMLPC